MSFPLPDYMRWWRPLAGAASSGWRSFADRGLGDEQFDDHVEHATNLSNPHVVTLRRPVVHNRLAFSTNRSWSLGTLTPLLASLLPRRRTPDIDIFREQSQGLTPSLPLATEGE
jgi:hypothetical protein